MENNPNWVCQRLGVFPQAPAPTDKVGIALHTLHLQPLNGLRHAPEAGTSGWYIWGGGEPGTGADFFVPMHVSHLDQRCPTVLAYLALPPGFRFLVAPGHEDIWFDDSLLGSSR
jgi:hypothetical protein